MFRCLGVVLLLVAGLKVYGLAVEPVSPQGIFSAAWFQMLLIQCELCLGMWLLSGKQAPVAWLTTCMMFTTFAAVSLYHATIGQASCGCLGVVQVSPWYAFAFDVAALLALWASKPRAEAWRAQRWLQRKAIRSLVTYLAGSACLLSFVGILAVGRFGSVETAAAYIRGERIAIAPRTVDVGEAQPGTGRNVNLELANYTDRPLVVFGGTSDCSCIALLDLPATIPPGGKKHLTLRIQFPTQPGYIARRAELFAGDGKIERVPFRITGRTLP